MKFVSKQHSFWEWVRDVNLIKRLFIGINFCLFTKPFGESMTGYKLGLVWDLLVPLALALGRRNLQLLVSSSRHILPTFFPVTGAR